LACRARATLLRVRASAAFVRALGIVIVAVATHRAVLTEAIVIVVDARWPRVGTWRQCVAAIRATCEQEHASKQPE
jgi:hypothetical protein